MDNIPDIVFFFGRFHSIVVHLPIGFLSLAILLEITTRWPKYRGHKDVLGLIWLLAAVSATLAVVLGLLLSLTGEYDDEALGWHKYAGMALAFLSFLCYILRRNADEKSKIITSYFLGFLVFTTSILLVITGHLGGSLTHGSDYLLVYAPKPIRKFAGISGTLNPIQRRISSLDSADIFLDAVMPIFGSKCSSCHNSKKKKGKLSVKTFDEILKGGETAPGITPGNLATSEIYRRITLPEEHEDFMPGEGKKPLTENQIAIIEWWIENDAPASGLIRQFGPNDGMVEVFNEFFGLNKPHEITAPPPDQSAMEALSAEGFFVKRLHGTSNLLEVRLKRKTSASFDVRMLLGLKDQIVWLEMSNGAVTDNDMATIGVLPNLIRLNLHNNDISDQGILNLQTLTNLEYLNLYGTKASDKSLQSFESMPKLKRLYLWDTKVGNSELIDSLIHRKPGLTITYKMPERDLLTENQPDSLSKP